MMKVQLSNEDLYTIVETSKACELCMDSFHDSNYELSWVDRRVEKTLNDTIQLNAEMLNHGYATLRDSYKLTVIHYTCVILYALKRFFG